MRHAVAAVVTLAMTAPAMAGGQWTDGPRSKWFKSLMEPDRPQQSCCDVSDCKETQARQLPDGSWEALWGGSRWISIPAEKVLKKPTSIDGNAYLCSTQPSAGEGAFVAASPIVFCFIPPVPGY